MNAPLFAAFALSAALGAFASTPAHAQDGMAASSSTAMAPQAMRAKDAMHGSMHPGGMTMKKGAMESDAMPRKAAKHGAMKHGAMKMKKDAAAKMKPDADGAMGNGG